MCEEVDRRADALIDASHEIHEHPEENFAEHHAHDLLSGLLEDEGFAVERPPTGSTRPSPPAPARRARPSPCCSSTTPCPASATPAATTSSPPPASGPGWRPPPWPTSSGAGSSSSAHRPRRAAGARSSWSSGGAFEGIDAAMMVHPADVDLRRMTRSPSSGSRSSYHGQAPTPPPRRRGQQRPRRRRARLHERAALRQHIRPTSGSTGSSPTAATSPTSSRPGAMNWYVRPPTSRPAAAEGAGAHRLEAGADATGCTMEHDLAGAALRRYAANQPCATCTPATRRPSGARWRCPRRQRRGRVAPTWATSATSCRASTR